MAGPPTHDDLLSQTERRDYELVAIVRIWRTSVDPARVAEYERFAETESLPMFRAQGGFLGVIFARSEKSRVVITFWQDIDAVARLATSPSYKATVDKILATGFLRGTATTEIFEIHGGQPPTL